MGLCCHSSIIRAILVEQLDVRVKSLLVRVRPHIPSRLEQPREAEIRCVHGAFAGIHEDIVEEASKGGSAEWCHHRDLWNDVSQCQNKHRDLTYPEVITSSRPHPVTVSNHVRNKTGPKVTSQVDGVAGLPAEARANAEDQEEQTQWKERSGANVAVVDQGENHKLQDGAGDELGKEHSCARHEGGGIRAEDTRAGGVQSHGPDAAASLEHVNGGLVVCIDNRSSRHGTEELANEVDGELPPRETAVEAVGERHCWVEVAARLATAVDSKHHSQTETPKLAVKPNWR